MQTQLQSKMTLQAELAVAQKDELDIKQLKDQLEEHERDKKLHAEELEALQVGR